MESPVTGGMVYVLIWWLVFFMVLPWGIQPLSDDDVGRGHDSAAPRKPRIITKMGITTVISAVIWGICYYIAVHHLISFR